jgi:hypothetical protein
LTLAQACFCQFYTEHHTMVEQIPKRIYDRLMVFLPIEDRGHKAFDTCNDEVTKLSEDILAQTAMVLTDSEYQELSEKLRGDLGVGIPKCIFLETIQQYNETQRKYLYFPWSYQNFVISVCHTFAKYYGIDYCYVPEHKGQMCGCFKGMMEEYDQAPPQKWLQTRTISAIEKQEQKVQRLQETLAERQRRLEKEMEEDIEHLETLKSIVHREHFTKAAR